MRRRGVPSFPSAYYFLSAVRQDHAFRGFYRMVLRALDYQKGSINTRDGGRLKLAAPIAVVGKVLAHLHDRAVTVCHDTVKRYRRTIWKYCCRVCLIAGWTLRAAYHPRSFAIALNRHFLSRVQSRSLERRNSAPGNPRLDIKQNVRNRRRAVFVTETQRSNLLYQK